MYVDEQACVSLNLLFPGGIMPEIIINSLKNNIMEEIGSKKRILTGIRPTATLTIANLIGAVFPLLELQKLNESNEILVFVATLHGLTDHEPEQLCVADIVKDYMALGLDPSKIVIFDQHGLRKEVALLKLYLERH